MVSKEIFFLAFGTLGGGERLVKRYVWVIGLFPIRNRTIFTSSYLCIFFLCEIVQERGSLLILNSLSLGI